MMTTARRLLPLLLATYLLAAFTCCNGRDESITLEHAEAFLPAQPDSADSCLCSIPEPKKLNESQRALYGLLRTYTDNRLQKGVKSDSLIRGIYEYYRDASRAGQTSDEALLRRYAQSCYYMALFYKACDSIKQCEELFNQAAKYSERCEDWHTCYLAHIQLCVTSCWSNPEYAVRQALKALYFYHKIDDDVNNEVLILLNIANMYFTTADTSKALQYYFEAYELAEQNNLPKSRNEVCKGIANTYLFMGENARALAYAQKAATMADSVTSFSLQYTLAECYKACDSLKKAKKIYELISHDSNQMNSYFVYRNLSEITFQAQDPLLAYAYMDSAFECLENRYLKTEHVKDEYYQENLAKELEKEQLLHQAELNRWMTGAAIIIFVLIALYVYNVLKSRIVSERKQRLNHLNAMRHEHAMHLAAQRELLHQGEVILQKNQTLSILQKYLLEKMEHGRVFLDKGKMASEEIWKEIEQLLDATDNGFVQQLRQQYRDFREKDIQLCMLVRLKMDNKTIANIYNIGIDAVKKRKLSLKKEGFHVTDPTIKLEEIVEKL